MHHNYCLSVVQRWTKTTLSEVEVDSTEGEGKEQGHILIGAKTICVIGNRRGKRTFDQHRHQVMLISQEEILPMNRYRHIWHIWPKISREIKTSEPRDSPRHQNYG